MCSESVVDHIARPRSQTKLVGPNDEREEENRLRKGPVSVLKRESEVEKRENGKVQKWEMLGFSHVLARYQHFLLFHFSTFQLFITSTSLSPLPAASCVLRDLAQSS